MGECADDAVFGDMDDEFRIDDDIDFDRYHDQRSRQPQARKVMDKQQHALRLAEWLEESPNSMDKLSAEELRRLHQVNQELVEALNQMLSYTAELNPNQGFDGFDHCAVNKAQAAIAKATGE